DGHSLAVGGEHPDGADPARARRLRQIVQVWDVPTRNEKFRFAVPGTVSRGGAFSADGSLLATTFSPSGIQVCHAATGEVCWQTTAAGLPPPPPLVGFSSDSGSVHAADSRGNVGFWELSGGRLIARRCSPVEGLVGVGYLASNRQAIAWGRTG